jgi:transposase-like protein
VEEARLGETVKCPKCGREGKLSLHYVYAKGFKYTYLAVAHEAFYGGRKSTRRCSLKLLKKEPAKPSAKQVGLEAAAKPEREGSEKLREENERLKSELARLEEENARLREENRQLREAIAKVYNAKIAWAGPRERRGFYLAAVRHRKGEVPAELRPVIDGMLETLSSVDWVAVRMDAFEQLRGFL